MSVCLIESAATPLVLINRSETNSPIGFLSGRSRKPRPDHAQEARPLFPHSQGSGFHLFGCAPKGPKGRLENCKLFCDWGLRASPTDEFWGPLPYARGCLLLEVKRTPTLRNVR